MQALIQSHRTSHVGMDTVLFVLHIRGLKQLLVLYFRVEEKFAGGKCREIPFAVDSIFAGGKIRAKSKFAKIPKINSTRKLVAESSEFHLTLSKAHFSNSKYAK